MVYYLTLVHCPTWTLPLLFDRLRGRTGRHEAELTPDSWLASPRKGHATPERAHRAHLRLHLLRDSRHNPAPRPSHPKHAGAASTIAATCRPALSQATTIAANYTHHSPLHHSPCTHAELYCWITTKVRVCLHQLVFSGVRRQTAPSCQQPQQHAPPQRICCCITTPSARATRLCCYRTVHTAGAWRHRMVPCINVRSASLIQRMSLLCGHHTAVLLRLHRMLWFAQPPRLAQSCHCRRASLALHLPCGSSGLLCHPACQLVLLA
jgi:hypothetical protein